MKNKHDFEKIFHEHYSPLCNYAAKIVKDYEIAEEIVQDLFVRLLENKSLEDVDHVDRFLVRSVKFKCIDFLRKQKKSNQVVYVHLLQTEVADNEVSSEQEVEALFEYLVAKLPPKTKEVFLLVRQSGLSYKEAAEQLHISDKTVENQMSRALKKLRMLLKDAGYLSWIYFSIFLK